MKTVTITPIESSEQGTFGKLVTEGFSCFTGELPWRNNQRQVSCIPEGEYVCTVVASPKFGRVYGVQGVVGRSHILIHGGNLVGDVNAGLRAHSNGCILLGKYLGVVDGQKAVLLSKPTVRSFMEAMAGQPFKLIIRR